MQVQKAVFESEYTMIIESWAAAGGRDTTRCWGHVLTKVNKSTARDCDRRHTDQPFETAFALAEVQLSTFDFV